MSGAAQPAAAMVKLAGQKTGAAEVLVWIANPARAADDPYVKAVVVTDGEAAVVTDLGAHCTVRPVEGGPELQLRTSDVHPCNPVGHRPDNTQLLYLNEPCVIENIAHRYDEREIYTWTSRILVAVNPYETVRPAPPALLAPAASPAPPTPSAPFALPAPASPASPTAPRLCSPSAPSTPSAPSAHPTPPHPNLSPALTQVDLYTDALAATLPGLKLSELPPHAFSVAEHAYRGLQRARESQAT